jgi:hypothetical protein
MQKKFKYAVLTEGSFDCSWYLDGKRIKELEYKGLIAVLNELGKDGWQAISINDGRTGAVLMKEYYIGG